jgi:hypothetical protein
LTLDGLQEGGAIFMKLLHADLIDASFLGSIPRMVHDDPPEED